jgi:16S rRNA (adenine1518-N6/adenine1519-N6)-dimethyltransferase
MKVLARKRYGQHFLHDKNVIRRIVAAIDPTSNDRIVEIGGGLGALSLPLAPLVAHIDVVEIDERLAAELGQALESYGNTRIHRADALKFDFGTLHEGDIPLRVVGNLPYNISTPLLFHLLRFKSIIRDMHVMLQKEVIDRMVAPPGSKTYGRLSVMLARWTDIEACFDIKPGSFTPPPRVMSSFARLTVRQTPKFPVADEQRFAALVAHLFSMRRKTLGRALHGRITAAQLAELGLEPMTRAETLSPAQLAALSDALP